MSQKIANRTTGLVDYKELETCHLYEKLLEEMTPLIKKLLEVSLESEIESHLSNNREEEKKRQKFENSTYKLRATNAKGSRRKLFEPQIIKKRQTTELETKVLSMFASGMSYRDIESHVE